MEKKFREGAFSVRYEKYYGIARKKKKTLRKELLFKGFNHHEVVKLDDEIMMNELNEFLMNLLWFL